MNRVVCLIALFFKSDCKDTKFLGQMQIFRVKFLDFNISDWSQIEAFRGRCSGRCLVRC